MDYQAAKEFILHKLETELSDDLYYHGKHHTLDVLQVTEELATALEVNEREYRLLQTAALFHDSGFTINNKEHERLGCYLARQALPDFGYTSEDVEMVCSMIMATKIPQSPKNQLEEIICDADLDYLGRDDFYSIGQTLFQELKAYHVLDNEEDWNRLQIRFLESHAFFTNINQERRAPQKASHLEALRELVATY